MKDKTIFIVFIIFDFTLLMSNNNLLKSRLYLYNVDFILFQRLVALFTCFRVLCLFYAHMLILPNRMKKL